MKITELEWVMENWDSLTPEEQAALDHYDLRKQHKQGELHYSLPTMVKVMEIIKDVYTNHNMPEENHDATSEAGTEER